MDCGGPLTDTETGQKVTEDSHFDWEDDDDAAEQMLSAFDTPNPYLKKLFLMRGFGSAPGNSSYLLREVSPDPDEVLLCAVKCGHGMGKHGFLVATTHYLRWIQTFPRRQDDFFDYAYPLEMEGNVVRTADGWQFQMGKRTGRTFLALYRVAQQAWNWEEAHGSDGPASTAPIQSAVGETDMASQLERLAHLLERGVLTEDEFARAKAKLLS